jgi:cAMP-dependent protein kinase regulator
MVEGTASATKVFDGVETRVKDYQYGDYFGELALISDARRAASILVTSEEASLVSLDKATFTRCLGKLETILKRNSEGYVRSKPS